MGVTRIEFVKLHALGNDFLVLKVGDEIGVQQSLMHLTRRICDRHIGVGADGVLCYHPTVGDQDSDFSILIFNADGSRAEISGNGLHCLAAYLNHAGLVSSKRVRIRTVAGIRLLTLKEQRGRSYTFESRMGHPIVDPSRLPQLLSSGSQSIIGYPISIGSEVVKVTICSLGNPHCSTFWEDLGQAPIESMGPLLEHHEAFPKRTNVEFIQVLDRHHLRARFWERGACHTLASGTGSCAAVVASILNDFGESPVTVETERGTLEVKWHPPDEILLTGPAELVCTGAYFDEAYPNKFS